MIYKKNYYYFTKAISPILCDKIIEDGLNRNLQEGHTGNIAPRNSKELENTQETRKSFISWIPDLWLKNELKPYTDLANKKAGWNFDICNSEQIQFTKYGINQHYNWHTDNGADVYQHGQYKGMIRKLSIIVSLSDPNDYEGGNLEFDFKNYNPDAPQQKHKCMEILPKGSVILFPSYTWHRVTPVTEGTRYSLVQWNLGYGYR